MNFASEPDGVELDRTEVEKRALRSRVRKVIAALAPTVRHEASIEACARVMRDEAFASAHVVMLYMPLSSEVDVSSIAIRCFQTGRSVGVPRVDAERRDMRPIEVESFDGAREGSDRGDGLGTFGSMDMEIDALGVRTPRRGRPLVLDSIDLVVVPGLAFDSSGHRIGRGGGFYDRFLAKLPPRTRLIGIAFDAQIVDRVPVSPHDIRVDAVVTERRTMETGVRRGVG